MPKIKGTMNQEESKIFLKMADDIGDILTIIRGDMNDLENKPGLLQEQIATNREIYGDPVRNKSGLVKDVIDLKLDVAAIKEVNWKARFITVGIGMAVGFALNVGMLYYTRAAALPAATTTTTTTTTAK